MHLAKKSFEDTPSKQSRYPGVLNLKILSSIVTGIPISGSDGILSWGHAHHRFLVKDYEEYGLVQSS